MLRSPFHERATSKLRHIYVYNHLYTLPSYNLPFSSPPRSAFDYRANSSQPPSTTTYYENVKKGKTKKRKKESREKRWRGKEESRVEQGSEVKIHKKAASLRARATRRVLNGGNSSRNLFAPLSKRCSRVQSRGAKRNKSATRRYKLSEGSLFHPPLPHLREDIKIPPAGNRTHASRASKINSREKLAFPPKYNRSRENRADFSPQF